jgi:hypothetical protein
MNMIERRMIARDLLSFLFFILLILSPSSLSALAITFRVRLSLPFSAGANVDA